MVLGMVINRKIVNNTECVRIDTDAKLCIAYGRFNRHLMIGQPFSQSPFGFAPIGPLSILTYSISCLNFWRCSDHEQSSDMPKKAKSADPDRNLIDDLTKDV